jgi:hypothetical protein
MLIAPIVRQVGQWSKLTKFIQQTKIIKEKENGKV